MDWADDLTENVPVEVGGGSWDVWQGTQSCLVNDRTATTLRILLDSEHSLESLPDTDVTSVFAQVAQKDKVQSPNCTLRRAQSNEYRIVFFLC